MLRRIVLTSTPILGAVAVSKADTGENDKKSANIDETLKCKPSELPLYRVVNPPKMACHDVSNKGAASKLEENIREVRIEVETVLKSLEVHKDTVESFYDDGKNKTKYIYEYLNQKDNSLPRAGAITLGGLSGIILGLRGGVFKRLIYGSISAGAIASVCYPKEAEVYAQQALVESKKYALIAYNFAYGIKPGDANNLHEFPKLPSNFDEVKDKLTNLAKSAKNAVFSKNE